MSESPSRMSYQDRLAWEKEQQTKLVAEDMKSDKRFKLGMIEESGYLCVGDPYQEPGSAFDGGSRTKGLNFKVTGTKKGQTGPGTSFAPLNPLCIGDMYTSRQERAFAAKKKAREDAAKLRRESRISALRQAGKDIAEVDDTPPPAWNPCGPHRKVEDIYLARVDKSTPDDQVLELIRSQRLEFTKKIQSAPDGEKVPTAPPNIRASPMKTNIIDAVTQYPWIPNSDGQELTKAEKMKQARQAATEGADSPGAWKPANPMRTNIIDACEQYEWIPDRDDAELSFAAKKKAERAAAAEADAASPWRPSNPMKKSVFDMTNKFPEHIPCPEKAPKRKKRGTADDASKPPSWKPSSSKRTRPVRSVALNRRNLGVYKANFFRRR